MRETKSGYREGDLFPLKTAMGNIVWTKILRKEYQTSFDKNEHTFLFDERAMLAIADEYSYRLKNKLDVANLDTGMERSGKSHYVYAKKKFFESPLYQDKEKLKEILTTDNWDVSTFTKANTNFNLDDITFELGDFKDRLKLAIEGYKSIITLDESGKGLSALNWFDKDQINLYIEFEIIGKKQINCDLVLPHKDDLNNRFRNRRVAFWHHILWEEKREEQKLERGFVEVRTATPSKWEIGIYWEPFIVFKFPDLSSEDHWKQYELKKDRFIQAHSEQVSEELTIKEMKYKEECNKLINEMLHPQTKFKVNYTLSEVGSIIGIKDSALSLRMKAWKMKNEMLLNDRLNKKMLTEAINEGVKNDIEKDKVKP